MRKIAILLAGVALTAASCDLGGIFSLGSGGRGILKSDDSGESFHFANKFAKQKGQFSVSPNALEFDPRNFDVLYLGSSEGIYKSEDAGETWTYILTGIAVGDIRVDPNSSNIVYAVGISGNNGKVIKSYDSGVTWVDIYSEASKGNTVLTIDVAKTNSKIIIVGLNSGEIIRSFDEGKTWQLVKDFGNRVIKVRSSGSTVYALTLNDGLFRSADLGTTWSSISTALASNSLFSRNNASVTVSTFYDLALDQKQSGVIYLGTQQGLVRSVDNGLNWASITLPAKDNSQLAVSSVAVNPVNSNNIYASISSTLFKSLNGGVTWETKKLPTTASVRLVLINPESSNTLYLGIGQTK
ncbi:MAG: hypothetical protein HY336_01170 [Candidatus Doudnabacteria bacterium]|nr:hypothetical protein [Candidatus Doudnabacteria bacterium]